MISMNDFLETTRFQDPDTGEDFNEAAEAEDDDEEEGEDSEKSLSDALDDLIKSSGEGSRGGKIIGHTRSGKPIYDTANHSAHAGRKHLSYQEAEQLHKKQWLEGKHKEWGETEDDHFFPYGEQYQKDGFVEVEISTKDVESVAHNRKRIDQYKEILKKQGEKSMGSLWVSAGWQKNDGTIERDTDQGRRPSFSALDGNHRLKAAQELGHPTQIAILPASHWKAHKEGAVVLKSSGEG